MTKQDGSFRRLVQVVKEQQKVPPQPEKTGGPGRPPKHRVPTTGYFYRSTYIRMKRLSEQCTQESGRVVSISDLYNDAARQLIADLDDLLNDDMLLPAGALTVPALLGLRELVDRPIYTPLRELEPRGRQKRTTLYLDQLVRDTLVDMSLRFSLQLRRAVHYHRLLELSAAWYLSGLDIALD
ncbi:MAG: hypothetical protein GYB65_02510 [Chloroflexi bacterium]|nr:hypothetical protein [Chloroflexota bacterium]